MILEMKVPSPGESITEVEIAQWLVSDGDYVKKDQAIAEVDSDKATLELPAEVSGVITLKAEEGDAVQVGAIVCLIDTEGKMDTSQVKDNVKAKPKSETPEKITKAQEVEKNYASQFPSPAAKKIMNEKGISSNQIKGSGRGGRITKEDVVKAVPSMGTPARLG